MHLSSSIFSFSLDTAPAREPLSLDEVKEHLRIDLTDDDALLARMITMVRKRVEQENNLALLTQNWTLFLDRFPYIWSMWDGNYSDSKREILVRKRPVQSIVSIKYLDTDGVQQTLAATEYTVDLTAFVTRIVPAFNKFWPVARCEPQSIQIAFVAGYGGDPDDVPEQIRQAMLLLLGHYYETREQTIVGQTQTMAQMAYESLMASERIRPL